MTGRRLIILRGIGLRDATALSCSGRLAIDNASGVVDLLTPRAVRNRGRVTVLIDRWRVEKSGCTMLGWSPGVVHFGSLVGADGVGPLRL